MGKQRPQTRPNNCLKKEARASQRKVGGGATRRPVAYRTTPGRPTGNTPFALAYGMDAIIPTEIGLPTIRTEAGRQDDANVELGRNLDWADEVRETASIRMADYQQRASLTIIAKQGPEASKMREDSSKNYKKKSSHWEGLPRSFSSSAGGIEGTSRLIPCFFIQPMVAKEVHFVSCFWQSASSSSFPQQTQPPTLLFALINATANPLSAFSRLTHLSGVASLLPSAGPSRPPPHAGGGL
ncbi:hypothetical protein CK203_038880 [Vitis vinifera]|uniref:Uncharacterized protein n=1 Tax=Vitis vinifera TaxID=29760 RepID=A0A438HG48_VITVI|nr:hypothetical protein CK203_038880 [Vitis vinifera]